MSTIAEQIYDAINRTQAVAESDASPSQIYCMQIAYDCIENKKSLIDILSKHPNWDAENYRVHFDKDYERAMDREVAISNLRDAMMLIIHTIDCRHTFLKIEYVAEEMETTIKLYALCNYIYSYANYFAEQSISQAAVDNLRNYYGYYAFKNKDACFTFEDAHIHQGTKCTKQVMKLMRQYGFDTLSPELQHDFLSKYSAYADSLNPLTITRHTVLSVNPVDFLYMSVGNSWSSCHNIISGGCYCAGCESYAYDTVSMILYTVDSDTPSDEITTAKKINRQMNFFNGDALVSCRVYPQNCDGDSEIYNEMKSVVQQILADCLGRPNLWRETMWGYSTFGLQYPDYEHFGPYKAYRLSDITLDKRSSWQSLLPKTNYETGEIIDYKSMFDIGSDGTICACCGGNLDMAESPICGDCSYLGDDYYTCDNCGRRVWYENGSWVHQDSWLCNDCYADEAFYCEDCNTDCWKDEGTWVESVGRYVCDDCLARYYRYCDECGEYFPDDDMTYIEGDDIYVCEDCRDSDFHLCEECGYWYRTNDLTYIKEDDVYVCEDCLSMNYSRCDSCGEYFKGNQIKEVDGGRLLCEGCMGDEGYKQCVECEEYFKDDELTETDNGLVCKDCLDEHYELKYVRKDN